MKKYLLLLFLPFLSACGDDDCAYTESTTVASSTEIANIQSYLDTRSITATQHPSGFFYTINNPGSGSETPGLCSGVTVKYIGKLTNGTIFDANPTGVTFPLGRLIVGWQKGIPLIKAGGSITLYIPPSLGYGSSAVGTIPPNSILVFDIELVDVNG